MYENAWVCEFLELVGEVTAINERGVFLRLEDQNGRFKVARNMVALLEAERNLKIIEGKPEISYQCLLQMTCEVVASLLARASFDDKAGLGALLSIHIAVGLKAHACRQSLSGLG